jgi:uncharacterized protein (TIGR02453 family)
MISKDTIEFLKTLEENNSREWFQKNKAWYNASLADFKQMIAQLIPAIAVFDKNVASLEVNDCLFRIYRDIRFSHDKTPYKTNFGAYMSSGGRKSIYAGYYFHLEPDGNMLAGGLYMPQPEILKRVRQEIYENIDEFLDIINAPDFKKYFGTIEGRKLKKCPTGFSSEFEHSDLLCYKDYSILNSLTDKSLLSVKSIDDFVKVFRAMLPLNSFINTAIKGD